MPRAAQFEPPTLKGAAIQTGVEPEKEQAGESRLMGSVLRPAAFSAGKNSLFSVLWCQPDSIANQREHATNILPLLSSDSSTMPIPQAGAASARFVFLTSSIQSH